MITHTFLSFIIFLYVSKLTITKLSIYKKKEKQTVFFNWKYYLRMFLIASATVEDSISEMLSLPLGEKIIVALAPTG